MSAAAATTCRGCTECVGQDHHWIEHCDDPAETPPGETPFAGYACKHCEARAEMCTDCGDPSPGGTLCENCRAGEIN